MKGSQESIVIISKIRTDSTQPQVLAKLLMRIHDE